MAGILNIAGKIIAGIVILIVILFAAILISVGILGIHAQENMISDYSYELYLSTSEPVYNATLMIPLPSFYDSKSETCKTFVNFSEITFKNFDTENISAKIEIKNGFPVLNISSAKILPIYKNRIMPIAIMPGQNESELPPVPPDVYSESYSPETPEIIEMEIYRYCHKEDGKINTKEPFDKEPLIRPYFIFNTTEEFISSKTGDYYSEFRVEVPVYLSYKTGSENILSISASVAGVNEWHVLGWQWNSYSERVSEKFEGSKNGTYRLKGILITGSGIY